MSIREPFQGMDHYHPEALTKKQTSVELQKLLNSTYRNPVYQLMIHSQTKINNELNPITKENNKKWWIL